MALQPGNIETLAKLMQARKQEGEEPFVLVLGAGASLSSGSPGMDEIIARIQEASGRDLSALSEEEIKAEFYNVLGNLSDDQRYLLLRGLFENARPSMGYLRLAELARGGYFKYILTTNFDWLLEDAFKEVGMTVNKDYAVFVVEKDEESQILRQLRFPRPPVKVLKLHGDLSARIFKFTPEEIFEFPEKLEKKIADLLSQALIIVGHSMRDADLNRCIRREGGAIWYVNPEAPKVNTLIWQATNVRKGSHYIRGDDGVFDIFFTKLYSQLYEIPISVVISGTEAIEVLELIQNSLRKELEKIQETTRTEVQEYIQSTIGEIIEEMKRLTGIPALKIPKYEERPQALARELLEEGEKIRSNQIKRLLKLLDQHYENLYVLEKQKLTASALVRPKLLLQIEEEKEEIRKIEEELTELGYPPPLKRRMSNEFTTG